jgi:hypothetical protein
VLGVVVGLAREGSNVDVDSKEVFVDSDMVRVVRVVGGGGGGPEPSHVSPEQA